MRSQKEAGAALVNRLRGDFLKLLWTLLHHYFIILSFFMLMVIEAERRKRIKATAFLIATVNCEDGGVKSQGYLFQAVVSQLYK